jgi:type I restriction enzyme M protein
MFNRANPVDREVAVITREQVEQADYNLSPSRWIGAEDDTAHRPLEELLAELLGLDTESATVSASLQRLLHGELKGDA